MKKNATDRRRGFTIIEVALVLAIGGLIFLMVFVALPSLQRSQRDARRRDDVMAYLEQLKKYQTNNRGNLPADGKWDEFMTTYFKGHSDPSGGDRYNQEVINCDARKADAQCNIDATEAVTKSAFPYKDYTFLVIKQGYCDGEIVRKTSNPRNVAVLYRLEGAGVYCNNT